MKLKYTDIYLVDCENVGLHHIKTWSNNILVYYFTSNESTIGSLQPHEREVHVYHSRNKDALDFIIDTKLGHLLCYYGKNVNFHIISYDKGFNDVCRFWQLQGYKVVRNDEYIEKPSGVDCFTLQTKYNIFSSGLSGKERRKLRNIYASWYRSKKKDYDNLKSQVIRSFYHYDKESILLLCDYMYYIGLEKVI